MALPQRDASPSTVTSVSAPQIASVASPSRRKRKLPSVISSAADDEGLPTSRFRPQGEVVHRPGREEPLSLHSPAAGIVLDGRLDAALANLGRSHGTCVAAAAASRRCRRSSASSAMVGSHSRYGARSNGLSSVR